MIVRIGRVTALLHLFLCCLSFLSSFSAAHLRRNLLQHPTHHPTPSLPPPIPSIPSIPPQSNHSNSSHLLLHPYPHQNPHPQPHFPIHIVFVGDSVVRYSYLDFVYRLHFPHSTPPKNITCYHPSITWNNFFIASTETFQGSMICDCFRLKGTVDQRQIVERRQYRHPSGKLVATFFQKFGVIPSIGKLNLSDARVYSNLEEAQKDTWYSPSHEDLANRILALDPKPTVVFIAHRFWLKPFKKADVIPELPSFMKTLLNHTEVLWLEGTPSEAESIQKHYDEKPTDDYVRNILCNSSHPVAVSLSTTRSCRFIPFPSHLRKEISKNIKGYYSDELHFINSTVYDLRIRAALHEMGLAHLYDLRR